MDARAADGVSPVRTADVIAVADSPMSAAIAAIPARGSDRFWWMSVLSALSGET